MRSGLQASGEARVTVGRDQLDRGQDGMHTGDAAEVGTIVRTRHRCATWHDHGRAGAAEAARARGSRAETSERDSLESVRAFRQAGPQPPPQEVIDLIEAHRAAYVVEPIGRGRVERLMRGVGLRGPVRGWAYAVTTVADAPVTRPPDLVQGDFSATRPNQVWGARITYVATWADFAYVAFVERRVLPRDRRLQSVALAEQRARTRRARAGTRCPTRLRWRRAPQLSVEYTSIRYTERLAAAGVERFVGSVGDSHYNAMAEMRVATRFPLALGASWGTLAARGAAMGGRARGRRRCGQARGSR